MLAIVLTDTYKMLNIPVEFRKFFKNNDSLIRILKDTESALFDIRNKHVLGTVRTIEVF